MTHTPTLADDILEGLANAAAYARGDAGKGQPTTVEVPEAVDVKALRTKLGCSQAEFAARFGFKLSALQEWEKRRRRPDRTARILLTIIDRDPGAVERALAG